jgi:hypothetical protein
MSVSELKEVASSLLTRIEALEEAQCTSLQKKSVKCPTEISVSCHTVFC